jgi:lysozyme
MCKDYDQLKYHKGRCVKTMINLNDLKVELIRDEGVRLSPYRCTAGKLTIGVGRNLDDNPLTKEEIAYVGHDARTKPISNGAAVYLLGNDIKKVIADLDKSIPWWSKLDDARGRVLVNMCFNLGIRGLLTFKTTSRIYKGTVSTTKRHQSMMQSKWATQVKGRAVRLSLMMKNGTA